MLKRRDFLRATMVTLGAAAIPGCREQGQQAPKPGADSPPSTTQQPAQQPPDPARVHFPQSVASGDPRPGSVILWTRVADPDKKGMDLEVELEVALDQGFTQLVPLDGKERLALRAEAAYDNCVKARIQGAPGTTYYYRFTYVKDGQRVTSRVGRTRTAPAEDADAPVRFAFVSCQDYIARYFNCYAALAAEEFDFLVHLGDYIYETTGDPRFQTTHPDRAVEFTDQDGARALSTAAGETFHAARSLDNYRELYRVYRGDRALQAVHERVPMIAIWDDHEFSDDSWGASGTYRNGREDELDVARRKAANQAWFEYMPVDYPDAPDFRYDPAAAFPGDIRIYRDFTFGKHVHLVLTDLRAYRPDHLVPEDAFPGAVVFDQAALSKLPGGVPALARPYVDIEKHAGGLYQKALREAADTLGHDPAQLTGNISVAFINRVVERINAGPTPPAQPIPAIDPAAPGLQKGLAWIDIGKVAPHAALGSRHFVDRDAFELLARLRYAADPKSQDIMGAEQEAWFFETMKGSTRTWKVWGNQFCLVPIQLDLQGLPVPPAFQRRFYMSVDAWDGFPDKRNQVIAALSAIGNVVAVTGDIHAFGAGTPWVSDDPSKKIVELVTGAISSSPYRDILLSQIKSDPNLSNIPGAAMLAQNIDQLLMKSINAHLGHFDSGRHGFCVAEASATELVVTMHAVAGQEVATDQTGAGPALLAKFQKLRFKTVAGASDLHKEIDGAWKRWDAATQTWV
jgi:alkaline phosphatase D